MEFFQEELFVLVSYGIVGWEEGEFVGELAEGLILC